MNNFAKLLAAASSIAAFTSPAAAQYQQPYQQPYQQNPQTYVQGQQGYGYGQPGYNTNGTGLGAIINQLLGNRYNVSDRTAVQQCASAAIAQAQGQYDAQGYNGHGYNRQAYGQQGYNGANAYARTDLRVTSITNVQRRNNGMRVTGTLGPNASYGGQAYANGGYAASTNLTFRCNVDNRGQVSNVRLGRRGY